MDAVAQSFSGLAKFYGVDADDPGLQALIALCSKHNLDPYAGEVFLFKDPGHMGSSPANKPGCGRDGYLAVANRHDDFQGMQGDVVHEKDTFGLEWKKTAAEPFPKPVVKHSYSKNATSTKKMDRGPIVGAWAIVYRDGRAPSYFFAKWSDYYGVEDLARSDSWEKYGAAMILKCAQSMALRLSFSISGFVPVDEINRQGETVEPTQPAQAPPTQEPTTNAVLAAFGDDPEIAGALKGAMTQVRELDPEAWPNGRLLAELADADDDQRREVVAEIHEDIKKLSKPAR